MPPRLAYHSANHLHVDPLPHPTDFEFALSILSCCHTNHCNDQCTSDLHWDGCVSRPQAKTVGNEKYNRLHIIRRSYIHKIIWLFLSEYTESANAWHCLLAVCSLRLK